MERRRVASRARVRRVAVSGIVGRSDSSVISYDTVEMAMAGIPESEINLRILGVKYP